MPISQIKEDSSGNPYVDAGNIRITYVPQGSRAANLDWAGSDIVRVQAYKGDPAQSQALHLGAEFPIKDDLSVVELVAGICTVYYAGRSE